MAVPTNRVLLLGRLLKRLDNFGVASFKERLILQKTVYLLQASGIFLGYSFNWYLHGPYSPTLAREGFDLSAVYDDLKAYKFSDPNHELAFRQFRELLGPHKDEADWLEAAASIHFLRNAVPHEPKGKTIKRVMAKGAHLDRELCEEVWTTLIHAGLIS